tara:strand:+ start:375 stop:2237 length:1863 start_codon:yes stop_codon:yes gene_type:complete
MCGISGFINQNKQFDNKSLILKMLNSIRHRGPDHTEVIQSEEFCGGYVRLSINDIKNGKQPFKININDNEIISFYNGEIYNYLPLKKELQRKGYKFKTRCDGEIIPSLYHEYGEKLFEKLEGMFAISIWDKRNKKLLLGRDHIGEKPLYYLHNNEEIIFSSEIKSIIKYKPANIKIDHQSIWDIPTFLWVPEPNTIFKEIKSLPFSSYLEFSRGNLKICSYSPKSEKKYFKNSSLINKTYKVVSNSIISRNLSDAPIGCFLSGGIDSSLVAKISHKVSKNLKTYTVAFDRIKDPYTLGYVDESKDAKKFAKKLKISNTIIKANAKNLKKEFNFLIKNMDQPMAISSAIGISMVARRAKQDGVKVLLSGDGADEMFCGYDWYKYIPQILDLKEGANNNESNISFQTIHKKNKSFLKQISKYDYNKLAWALHYYASEYDKHQIFSDNFRNSKKSSLRLFNRFKTKKINTIDFINNDRNFYLNNEMLFKLDRCTMLHSIESRSPFTSSMIKNFVAGLKIKDLMKSSKLKYLIKEAFKKDLPQNILNKPKHGFTIPVDHYLLNDWSDLVNETFSKESKIYKMGFIDKKSLNYVNKILKSKNKLSGHTILSYISINSWLENNSWK